MNIDNGELTKRLHKLFFDQSLQYPVDSSEIRWNLQEACKVVDDALAAQRQALRDEVMGAIGEDEPETIIGSVNLTTDRVRHRNQLRQELRAEIIKKLEEL